MNRELINKLFPYVLLFLSLTYILLSHNCSGDKNTSIKQTLPSQKGSFVKYNPTPVKDGTLVYRDTIIYKDKKIIVDNTDTTYVGKYLRAKDSIEKLKVVLSLSKKRKYSEKFENDTISLNIEAETTGTLNYLKPSWVIKERTIDTPIKNKESVFAVYGGFEIYNNKTFSNPGVKVELDFQNRKGNILSIGGDTNQNIYLGYKVRLINIKK